MSQERESFKDLLYRGMDALMHLTSKAGESLRTYSSEAIEKIDEARLERQLDRLYAALGKRAFDLLEAGNKVSVRDKDLAGLVEEIRVFKERLFFNKAAVKPAEKAETEEADKS